ncbi:hypothetical protein ACJ41O_001328 [Fusarium nematophilum]
MADQYVRPTGIYGDASEVKAQQATKLLNRSTGNARQRRPRESTWTQLRKRFGIFEIIIFAIGIIGILVPTILLALMWHWGVSAESNLSNNALTTLALRNWLPQFITIMTAVLRFAIGAHVLTCCMMMASLALKRSAITIPEDRHFVTILQEAGPGPTAMVLPFMRAAIQRRFLRGFFITCALLAVSTVSQFASTMLLSDLRPTHLLAEPRLLTLNMSTGNFDSDNDLAKAGRPVEYPVFAERMEGRNEILPRDDDRGLFDTGNVSRAYFPLSAEERVRVQDYTGFATVLTTHTICFAPDLTNITIVDLYRTSNLYTEKKGNGSDGGADFAFAGTIPPPESRLYSQYRGDRSFNFDRLEKYNLTGFVADACPSFAHYGINICSMDRHPWDVIPDEGRTYTGTGDIDDPGVEWFLITRMQVPKEAQAQNLTRLLDHGPTVGFEGSEWTRLSFSDDEFSMVLHHSLCATRTLYTWANVSAASSRKDPIISEEPFAARRPQTNYSADDTYNLDRVMRQLGVEGREVPSTQTRGDILLLKEDRDLRNRTDYLNATISVGDVMTTGDNIGGAVCIPVRESLANDPKVYGYNICRQGAMAEKMAEQLFVNTLASSRSLALAFEALSTFMFLSIYTPISTKDAGVNMEDEPKIASVSFIDDRLVPRRFLGFGLVMGVLACHVLLVGEILRMFIGSDAIMRVEEVARDEE